MQSESENQLKFGELVIGLQTENFLRTVVQVKRINLYMSSILYFRKVLAGIGEDGLNKLCGCMRYEFFSSDEFICRMGDTGDKFYVILKGAVRVIVESPNKEEAEYESGQLFEGMTFGEYALIHNQPRIASVQCIADTHLAAIGKEDFISVLGKFENKRSDEFIKFLRNFAVFRKWSKNPIVKISYFFREKTLPRKSVIFREGDEADSIIFIKSGELELLKSVKSAAQSKSLYFRSLSPTYSANVSILGSGETVGENFMLTSKHLYTCRVYSFTATVLIMSKHEFCRRVRTEDIQSAMVVNDKKEKERSIRVNSVKAIKAEKSYYETEEITAEKVKEVNKSRIRVTIGYIQRNKTAEKTRNQSKNLSEVEVKHCASRSGLEINSPASQMFNYKFFEARSTPNYKRNHPKLFERRKIYPLKIEQKRIFDRGEAWKQRHHYSKFNNFSLLNEF